MDMKILHYGFPFLVLLLAACQTHKQPAPVETGISKQLADWRLKHISNLSYQLKFISPASRTKPIHGELQAAFQLDTTDRALQFDFKGTAVQRVVVNGKAVPVRWETQHVILDRTWLKKGVNTVAMQFTSSDQSLNRNDDYLYTLFVPDRASTAFPCFDQPNLKATFQLELTVPDDWKAVANGPEVSVEKQASGTVHRFAMTQPLPTYLFAFVAGQFETVSREHKGHTYTLYQRETNQEKLDSNLDDIFRLLFFSMDQIEAYTGMPYPFAKYDFVAVPSLQYGGMEHPGVLLYHDKGLFLEGEPTARERLNRANLIAHETSHMWFGDLVTMSWFDEVWLKEVFANFIADKVTAPLFPDFNRELLFLTAHYAAAYSVDRTAGTNPITQPLDNLKDAGTLYGMIIYHKAPIVMGMLEDRIGEQALQEGLRQYLLKYCYGNAGWNELIDLLDGSLRPWSKVWVEESGRPHLSATISGEDLMVRQEDPAGKGRIWPQQIEVVWSASGELHRKAVDLDRSEIRLTGVLPESGVDWLTLNGNGKAYGFVELDAKTRTYFAQHLSEMPDVLLRAAAWIDLHENEMEGIMPPSNFAQAVIRNLPSESDTVLYDHMLAFLTSCYVYRLDEGEKAALQPEIEAMLLSQLAARPDHATALCNAAIAILRSPAGLDTLYAAWETKELQENPLTETQQTTLALELALHLPEKADAILDAQEARLDNPDLKARFRFIRPAVSQDQAVRDRLFQSFAQAENREHEPWVLTALYYLNDPDFAQGREYYIEPGLELLPELQQTGDIFFPQGWAISLLAGHRSEDAAKIVRNFLSTHPDFPPRLRLMVLQAADQLLRQHPE